MSPRRNTLTLSSFWFIRFSLLSFWHVERSLERFRATPCVPKMIQKRKIHKMFYFDAISWVHWLNRLVDTQRTVQTPGLDHVRCQRPLSHILTGKVILVCHSIKAGSAAFRHWSLQLASAAGAPQERGFALLGPTVPCSRFSPFFLPFSFFCPFRRSSIFLLWTQTLINLSICICGDRGERSDERSVLKSLGRIHTAASVMYITWPFSSIHSTISLIQSAVACLNISTNRDECSFLFAKNF